MATAPPEPARPLPPELLCLIHAFLPPASLPPILLVSRQFNALSTSLLYRTVKLTSVAKYEQFHRTITAANGESGGSGGSPNRLGGMVRHLTFADLGSEVLPSWTTATSLSSLFTALTHLESLVSHSLPYHLLLSSQLLATPAFASLKKIKVSQSQSWRLRLLMLQYPRDTLGTLDTILQLPNLEHLDLGPFILPLPQSASTPLISAFPTSYNLITPANLTFLHLSTVNLPVQLLTSILPHVTSHFTTTIDLKVSLTPNDPPLDTFVNLFTAIPRSLRSLYINFEPSEFSANPSFLAQSQQIRLEEHLALLPPNLKLLRVMGRFFGPQLFERVGEEMRGLESLQLGSHFQIPVAELVELFGGLAVERPDALTEMPTSSFLEARYTVPTDPPATTEGAGQDGATAQPPAKPSTKPTSGPGLPLAHSSLLSLPIPSPAYPPLPSTSSSAPSHRLPPPRSAPLTPSALREIKIFALHQSRLSMQNARVLKDSAEKAGVELVVAYTPGVVLREGETL
ncbi:hypothetical protein MNV49_003459 [Pseudohyphozyma bogoriensis]|nr:hypothetical protein MNV49_003459 [Pseudohyphozyma bogoriensis]